VTVRNIKINDWSELEEILRKNIGIDSILLRNFGVVSVDPETYEETNRLQLVIDTGTDRCIESFFWNAQHFDFENNKNASGKMPNEIIYASLVDLTKSPYQASVPDGQGGWKFEVIDLTQGLSEYDAITAYDPGHLDRKSANEYWFKSSPINAALLVVSIAEE
jgi:hypothetical protein